MKVVTTRQMRNLDRLTIKDFETPGEVLMDRAGLGVAEAADYLSRTWGYPNPPIICFAGRGNNGGDAFAAARYLKDNGHSVQVWLAGERSRVTGDARTHLGRLRSTDVKIRELPTMEDWEDAMDMGGPIPATIFVDGLLGTGIRGPARGPVAGAIQFINTFSSRCLVLAIDIPSGLDSDRGVAEGDAVRADMTVTMGLPKRGLTEPCAVDYVGAVEVVDIGIPGTLLETVESDRQMLTAADLRPVLKRRHRDSHKGTYGHVLIVGGAAGYTGAAAMACQAALRSGAGLVSSLVPERLAPTVAGLAREAMVYAGTETKVGSLAADALDRLGQDPAAFDAVLIGPGMTPHVETRLLVDRILETVRAPVVLDADALNVLAGEAPRLKRRTDPLVLTPHPGELARLLQTTVEKVQADRYGMVRRTAEATGAIVVLKGAGTLIAAPDQPTRLNLTGNPGMAKGGMGDILAGLMVGLLGQGINPLDAASAAVYLHGRAGDLVALRNSQAGMTAGDVLDEFGGMFRDLVVR